MTSYRAPISTLGGDGYAPLSREKTGQQLISGPFTVQSGEKRSEGKRVNAFRLKNAIGNAFFIEELTLRYFITAIRINIAKIMILMCQIVKT